MKPWKVAIVKDTSKPMLGLHGLHVAFRGLPNVEVVAHVDANTQRLTEKMQITQARRHYATCRQMLRSESPDIAVLCSRHPEDHLPQIRELAERGCHVYCEKPLAATLAEADQILAIATRHRVKIAMAHPARHDLGFRTIKRLIAAGDIGTPLTVHGRGKSDHRGGGEDLVVLGTHILDLQRFLFGSPQHVFADITTAGRPTRPADRSATVEPIGPVAGDSVLATFLFPGGVRGLFESHRGLFAPGKSRGYMGVTVTGTNGSLAMRFEDAQEAALKICRGPCAPEAGAAYQELILHEDRVIPGAAPLEEALCYQPDIPAPMFLASNRFAVWDLMGAIQEDREPVASVHDAIAVLEMIHGIYASHFARRAIALPLADRQHPLLANQPAGKG